MNQTTQSVSGSSVHSDPERAKSHTCVNAAFICHVALEHLAENPVRRSLHQTGPEQGEPGLCRVLLLIFGFISINLPVCVPQLTTYTTLMQVSEGTLESYIRDCPNPCMPW